MNTFDKNAIVPSSADTGVIIIADNVYHVKPEATAREPNKFILNNMLHNIPPNKLPRTVAAGTINNLNPTFFRFLKISLLLPISTPTEKRSMQSPMSSKIPVALYRLSGIRNNPDKTPTASTSNIFLVISAPCYVHIMDEFLTCNINKQNAETACCYSKNKGLETYFTYR
ncbi:MAG: hypothetical protein K0Q47_821 [Sedimentibacter sp.]|nr:hypothetical protein [Sedimentibacter sp.]